LIKVKRTFSISLRHLIFTFLASLFLASSFGQKLPYSITIVNPSLEVTKELTGEADSLRFQKIVKIEYLKLLRKGNVVASVKQTENDTLYQASISTGSIYRWGSFNVDQIPEVLLSKTGFSKKQFDNTKIDVSRLSKLIVKIIEESDHNGYPFTTIKLDSVKLSDDHISANILYSSGQRIKYAAVELNKEFIKTGYLESYLKIRQGALFNSSQVDAIENKIDKLTYCKLEGLPKIRFENKSCKIALNISSIRANTVDAMLGLAPNQLEEGKMLATGYVKLDLHNLFKSGKRITFNWQQFGVQSQMLNARYIHTNLFKSVINLQGEFNLFKQDTTFINRDFRIDIGYDIGDYIVNITSNFITSKLLSGTDINKVEDLDLIDFNAQYYGAEISKIKFDNIINPSRGWSSKAKFNVGSKTILNTSFVPNELYDSLEKQSLQSNMSITSELALPISNIFIAYSKFELATIASNGKLFSNDLYRLGGINSLRGFNELEIYSSAYAMLQLEARLLLGENSRLFGFADWAYSRNEVLNNKDNFLGIGAGLLLDTPSGVIQLVYAVGKSSKQLLSLTESKIHFGYVARF
jgi:surface antigen Omp85-like protein